MSLYMITGIQGGGKSVFAVSLILKTLQQTRMSVLTNLDIVREEFFTYGWPKDPVKQMDARQRLYFPGDLLDIAMERYEQCPDDPLWRRDRKEGPYVPEEQWVMQRFWHFKPNNCAVILDEVYWLWPSDRGSNPDLLAYCKQHRHLLDEIYLISHDQKDVHQAIRRSLTGRYDIENTLQKSPFTGLLAGLTVPRQFFRVKRFYKEHGQLQESYAFHPAKRIFTIYKSLNKPTNLPQADALNPDMESSDYSKSRWRKQTLAWAGQLLPYVLGVVFAVGVVLVVGLGVWGHLFGSHGQRMFGVGGWAAAARAVPGTAKAQPQPVVPVSAGGTTTAGGLAAVVPGTSVPSMAVPATVVLAPPPLPESGKVVAFSAQQVVTDKGVYTKGQEVGAWILESWSSSGLSWRRAAVVVPASR